MSKNQYGLIIAGDTGGIDNDTATKNFDSREFTFKYLDRKLYNGGVYRINSSEPVKYPAPQLVVPHNLGYSPSYRFYVYARDANNDYAGNNHQYEMMQGNGSGSVVNLRSYMSKTSFYILAKSLFGAVSGSDIYLVLLIGADNLEADADETRYIS